MRIDETYNIVVDLMRKERNGFISIPQFNLRCPQAVLDAFNFFNASYGVNQQSHDALDVFKRTLTFTSDANGVVALPNDCARLLKLKPNGSVYSVDFYNEDEIDFAVNSSVRPISSSYVIGEMFNDSVQLYPKATTVGTGSYFKFPDVPKYAFTLVGRTVTYDAVNSVDVEFSDVYMWKVIQRLVLKCGVNLSDEKAISYGQTLMPQ